MREGIGKFTPLNCPEYLIRCHIDIPKPSSIITLNSAGTTITIEKKMSTRPHDVSIARTPGLRISVVEGAFAQVHINITAGMFLTSFALYVGLNNIGIGFLSAIPAFCTGFGFFSLVFVKMLGSRRTLCVIASGFGRGIFLVLGAFLLFDVKIPPEWFFILITLYNLLMNLSSNAWLSWMTDLVPRAIRGRYFAFRNTILNLIGMVTTLLGGRILDAFKAVEEMGKGLGVLFTGASVSSTIAANILSRQPDPQKTIQAPSLRTLFFTPLHDRSFRQLLIFIGVWYLFGGMASPFFVVHMLTNLSMSYSTIALYSIVAGVSSLIFQILWGKAIDTFRAKPVLVINYFLSACLPLFWLFARPDFLLPIWIDAFLTGIFWTGINLSLFNIVLNLTENKSLKEGYFAVFATITGIVAFVASVAGGYIAQWLSGVRICLYGLTFVNYHFLFALTSIVRLTSGFLLLRVEDRFATPAVQALQLMGDYTLRRLELYRGLILNTFRFRR